MREDKIHDGGAQKAAPHNGQSHDRSATESCAVGVGESFFGRRRRFHVRDGGHSHADIAGKT